MIKIRKYKINGIVIKLVSGYCVPDRMGGYKAVYRDFDYYCSLHVCHADYGEKSILKTLEPNFSELAEHCARVQKTGNIEYAKPASGYVTYVLTPNKLGKDRNKLEIDKLRNSIIKNSVAFDEIENVRVSLFEKFDSLDDDLISVQYFIHEILNGNVGSKIRRWIFDCGKFSGAAIEKILIAQGAEQLIQAEDIENLMTLIFAINDNDRSLIQSELNRGINLNQFNDYGDSPLIWAIRKNDLKTIELLLANGADVFSSNQLGRSAIDVANEFSGYEIRRVLLENK